MNAMNKNLNIRSLPISQPEGTRERSLEAVIHEQPFLQGFSPHQERILVDSVLGVTFEKDEVIFRAGNPADRFYLICRGRVALESYVNDRGICPIQTIGPGDVLGWSWLFPPYYSAL